MSAPGLLRAVTWNVQCSSEARAREQLRWLAGLDRPDVVVLTEVSPGAGGRLLAAGLEHAGYHVRFPGHDGDRQVLTATRARHQALPVPGPAGDGRQTAVPVPGFAGAHRFPAVTWTAGRLPVTVAGLYVPSRGPRHRRNVDKRAFQDAVAGRLAPLAARPGLVLVCGDLNVVEPGHTPHHAVFGAWEYAFYRAFPAAGLADAFRHRQPDTVDHSWFGRSGHGYRFDHMFITHRHRAAVTGCRYLHQPRTDGLSDHAAMTVTLDPGAV